MAFGNVNVPGWLVAAAKKLETARTIKVNLGSTSAANFDGSANITPGVSGILQAENGGTGNNSGYIRRGQKSGTTIGPSATAEGGGTTASSYYAHAEGYGTTASGESSHAEGRKTIACGEYGNHAEGFATFCCCKYGGHAEGNGCIAANTNIYIPLSSYSGAVLTVRDATEFSYLSTVLSEINAGMEIYIWNDYYAYKDYMVCKVASVDVSAKTITLTENLPTSNFRVKHSVVPQIWNAKKYNPAHAEGSITVASGESSHAEGYWTTASGENSHAEGYYTVASGIYSHAEGSKTTASESCSHAEGYMTTASGTHSHAEGQQTTASGIYSHAEGSSAVASGNYSHAGGRATIAAGDNQTAIGGYNVESALRTDKLIIGKGSSTSARANCFRVTDTGVYATGSYSATGADYAELFEWADGNPDDGDRCGMFVTLDGEKIRLAGPEDDYILGIVSGNPSVIGDVHDDQWQGMYLYDIFGRPIWEDVEVPAVTEERTEIRMVETGETDEDGSPILREEVHTETVVIEPAHMERRQKLNPDYDEAQQYIPRTERPEWGCVGMMGKLTVIDDGTCQVNGWCTPGEGGVATASDSRTKFRVMARLDDTHIRVMIL